MRTTVRREALGVRGGLWWVVAVLAFYSSLLTPHASPLFAGCDHHYQALTGSEVPVDCSGSIHATTADYYRGAIYTFDHGAGICRVTAWLKFTGDDWNDYFYTARIWSLSDDNLATLLGTSTDSYQGGNWTNHDDNWTATKKVFHFYWPVAVPAGRVAITINDTSASAHPDDYHSWCRSSAKTGQESCSWDGAAVGNCTDEYSQAMEIDYVETPFLTADPNGQYLRIGAPPYTFQIETYYKRGWLEIPEWAPYGANLCEMDDNITVACELPDAIADTPGAYKVRARFRPPNDDNASHYSNWSHALGYKIKSSPSGTITQHHSGDSTATVTGVYR